MKCNEHIVTSSRLAWNDLCDVFNVESEAEELKVAANEAWITYYKPLIENLFLEENNN